MRFGSGSRFGGLATAALIAASSLASAAGVEAAAATAPGRLAISSFETGQIYSLNPDGTQFRQLTHVPAGHYAANPDWSPDGTHIVFESDLNREVRIYTMAADGSHRRMILGDQAGFVDALPRYTPDGRSIVFARCKPNGGVCAIFSVHLDGTHLTGLTRFQEGTHEAFDFFPAISPDGTHIAFARFVAGGIQAQIWVMDADGRHAHAVTNPALQATFPNWSSDGRRISFSSNCCRLGGNIYTVSPAGGQVHALTHTPYPLFSGLSAYSPDGARIAFISNRNHPDRCCTDLFVMDANGAHPRMVHTGLGDVARVAWQN